MSKKALVFGYHGMKNVGDDFFLDYCVSKLQERGYGKIYVSARKGALPEGYDPSVVIPFMPKRVFLKGYDKWLFLFFYALRVDCFLMCAGSLFSSLPARLLYLILLGLKFFNPNIRIYAIGVSVGPFPSRVNERVSLKALSFFDEIITRDSRTVNKLENAQKSRDIAFTAKINSRNKKNGLLGICLNQTSSDADERKRIDLIVQAVKSASEQEAISEVKVFVTCSDASHGDISISKSIYERLRENLISVNLHVYSGDWVSYVSSLSECEKVIASRLHAGFFSLLSSSKVFQLSYAAKNKDFYSGLNFKGITFSSPYNISFPSLLDFLLRKSGGHNIEDDKLMMSVSEKTAATYDVFWEGV